MKYEIKVINEKDIKQVYSLFDSGMKRVKREDFITPYRPGEIKKYLLFNDLGICIGAYVGEKLIGIGVLLNLELGTTMPIEKTELNIEDKKVCMLVRYFVSPSYQRQGIMSSIQKELIKHAKINGFDVVLANVHPENIPSLRVLSKDLTIIKTINYYGIIRHLMKLDLIAEDKYS